MIDCRILATACRPHRERAAPGRRVIARRSMMTNVVVPPRNAITSLDMPRDAATAQCGDLRVDRGPAA